MKIELQDKLDAIRDRLVNELDISIGFLATLVVKKIITAEIKEKIDAKKTVYGKVDQLLDNLKRRPEECFYDFRDCLEGVNKDLYRLLCEDCAVNTNSRSMIQDSFIDNQNQAEGSINDRIEHEAMPVVCPTGTISDRDTANKSYDELSRSLENICMDACTESDIEKYVNGFRKVRCHLIEYIDPENGLADLLFTYEVINRATLIKLNAKQAYRELNRMLIWEFIDPQIESCCSLFMKALIHNEQEHIVKFIISQETGIDWQDRMLTREERNIIDKNAFCLMKLINPYLLDFLNELAHLNCITREHKDKVVTWYDQYKDMHELLKILQRRTYNDFTNFKRCLSKSMQDRLILILDKGGVVEIRVKLQKRMDKKVIESKLIEILTGFVDESNSILLNSEQETIIRSILKNISDAGIHFIGICSSRSMNMYFQYDTAESFKFFISFCGSGQMKATLEKLFRFLLPYGSPCFVNEVSLKQYSEIHETTVPRDSASSRSIIVRKDDVIPTDAKPNVCEASFIETSDITAIRTDSISNANDTLTNILLLEASQPTVETESTVPQRAVSSSCRSVRACNIITEDAEPNEEYLFGSPSHDSVLFLLLIILIILVVLVSVLFLEIHVASQIEDPEQTPVENKGNYLKLSTYESSLTPFSTKSTSEKHLAGQNKHFLDNKSAVRFRNIEKITLYNERIAAMNVFLSPGTKKEQSLSDRTLMMTLVAGNLFSFIIIIIIIALNSRIIHRKIKLNVQWGQK